MSSRRLLIVAEGNPQIGFGHLKRQADLVTALRARSPWQVSLATAESTEDVLAFFRTLAGEIDVVPLAGTPDLPPLMKRLAPDVVVIDLLNGRFHATAEAVAGSRAFSLGVVDWSEPRPAGTAMLLNANPCQLASKRAFYADAGVTALLGPRYFMAAPGLAAYAPRQAQSVHDPAREILVALGGGDVTNALGRVLDAVVPLARARGLRVRVLQSPTSLFMAEARARFEPDGVEFLGRVTQMGPLLRAVDLLVASHGNIAYESAVLGVPMIAANLVACQQEQAEEMARLGAVVNAGLGSALDPQRLRGLVERCLEDALARAAMSRRRMELVDGQGLERLLAALSERLA